VAIIYADGLGVWTEHDRTVAFYLEHDTGTEALTVLVDKLRGYQKLLWRGGPAWPVVFWLHSATREAHLHHRLTETQPDVPVATAARDRSRASAPPTPSGTSTASPDRSFVSPSSPCPTRSTSPRSTATPP
jgi:hypothetical protein